MISVSAATWIVRLAALYLGLGLVFALGFAFRWVNRTDSVAAHGTSGFRLLLLPGATLLWPLLARRLLRGDQRPPVERTAHRTRQP
jgi:hypothetical protein